MIDNIVRPFRYQPKLILPSYQVCWSAWNVVLGAACMLLNQYLHHHCHLPLLQESAGGTGTAFSLRCLGSKLRENSKPAWTVNLHVVLRVQTLISEDTSSVLFTLAKETAVQWKQRLQTWHVVEKKREALLQSWYKNWNEIGNLKEPWWN